MKEEATDHVVSGFKTPADGWHKVTFQEGIGFLPAAGQTGVDYQNERGFKTLKLPCIVDDQSDLDHGGYVQVLVNLENGGKKMAGILKCTGLWAAVEKKYPGKDVSVFDPPVLEGIKSHLQGKSCMIRTEIVEGKKGGKNAVEREIASFEKYKEIEAEEKKKALNSKKAVSETHSEATTAPAGGENW